MRESYYNFIYQYSSDSLIIYNSLTNAMIEIEADNYKRIFLDKGETTAEEYSFLAKGGGS